MSERTIIKNEITFVKPEKIKCINNFDLKDTTQDKHSRDVKVHIYYTKNIVIVIMQ
jgi:hypothetical protein